MDFSIGFKNLPFVPEENQVIYVESVYDEKLNDLIRRNYEVLKQSFEFWGFCFVYLPLYFKDKEIEDKIRYTAPYIPSSVIEKIEKKNSYLLDFMTRPENRAKILPSLICCPRIVKDEWIFNGFTFDMYNVDVECSLNIAAITQKTRDIYYKNKEEEGQTLFRRGNQYENTLKTVEEKEIEEILANLQNTVRELRLRGVALGAIREIIDNQEPLSSLVITDDLRIFLPAYNNIEIVMSAQIKALYFLFLNHPEGIVLQNIEEYHSELINYYKQTSKGVLTPKMEESIRRLEVYGNNQINVLLTRIREAFCFKFDEHLARNYYVSGEKGEVYGIPLNPELIEWRD
jgi:hypothetical protein